MPTKNQRNVRHVGRWIAGGVALLAIVIVAAMIVFSRPPKTDPRDALPPPPDITSRPTPLTDGPTAGAGEGTVLQFLDKQDPGREAGRLLVERMEPLEARRFLLQNPRIILFLKDGRTAHIRADTGRFYMPSRDQPPESGILEGAGVARLFVPREDGSPIDYDNDVPLGVMNFTTLSFDMTLGEVSTDDRVVITSEQVEFAGKGVRAFIDQTRERLSRAEVRAGEYIRFIPPPSDEPDQPSRRAEADSPPRPRTASGPAPAAGRPRGTAAQPATQPAGIESRYHAVFLGEVKVTRDAMVLTGDRLDLWARLFDNRLREGAIAPVRFAPSAKTAREPGQPQSLMDPVGWASRPPPLRVRRAMAHPTAEGVSNLAVALAVEPSAAQPGVRPVSYTPAQRQPTATESATPNIESPPPSPVELTWNGPLTITPRDDVPEELGQDDVALRFTADATGLVKFRDEASSGEGHCSVLQYWATSRRLALSGPGPVSVALQSPTLGRIESVRITADLATGIVHIPTPGLARSADRSQRISWTQQADLQLRIEDEALAGLRTAIFQGDVRAADAGGTLDTAYLRSEFERLDDGSSSLAQLIAEQSFEATGPDGETLRGQRADVRFKPTPGATRDTRSADPTLLIAEGAVTAKNNTTTLTAEYLDTDLSRDDEGRLTIGERAIARGNAVFVQAVPGTPRIEAHAHEITARPSEEHVTLLALPNTTASVKRGHTHITGPQIVLDGQARTLWVLGDGALDHAIVPPPADVDGVHAVHAAWSREMRLDDLAGDVDCLGDVVARAEGPFVLDTMKAERVVLKLEPAIESESAVIAERDEEQAESSGRLLHAYAEGASLHRDGGARASIEVRRYDPASGARRLERLAYLEGDRIEADNIRQTLDVPGPGRLLLVDRRSESAQGATASDAPANATTPATPGSTRFDWVGSMHLDRTTGAATMREMVQLTHKPWPSGELVFLEAEELVAMVREKAVTDRRERQTGVDEIEGELLSATATGAVYLRSEKREMIADSLVYDAQTGIAVATAAPGNRVTMFEIARGAVVRAGRLRWDLVKDEIRVEEAEPVTVPHARP